MAHRHSPDPVTPLVPPVRRLLLVDRAREELAAYVRARRPEIETRRKDRAELTPEDITWADAYLGFRPPLHLSLNGIAWVHSTGAGIDAYTFRYPLPPSVLLTRSPEPFGGQIGEWCVARALLVTQELFSLADAQRTHTWAPRDLRGLRGEKVLVVGTGGVGASVGEAFAAMGCEVHGVSRSGTLRAPFRSVRAISELSEAVKTPQWIVLTLPLTEETYHLFDAHILSSCRGAYLMNAGRGALTEEVALVEALDAGRLSGAALDVFEKEPLPGDSPLWDHPKVVIAPHISGLTTLAGAGDGFLETLALLEGGIMPSVVVDLRKGY